MTHHTTPFRGTGAPAAALALAGLLAACAEQQKEDIEAGAQPLPIGTYTREYFTRMANKAEADDFTFYRMDFVEGRADLNASGKQRLDKVLPRMLMEPFPIVIEPDDNAPLNEARRKAMVGALTRANVLDPETRVVVTTPAADGADADEAAISRARSQRSNSGSGMSSGGGGSFGGHP